MQLAVVGLRYVMLTCEPFAKPSPMVHSCNVLPQPCPNYDALPQPCPNYDALPQPCPTYDALPQPCQNYDALPQPCQNYNVHPHGGTMARWSTACCCFAATSLHVVFDLPFKPSQASHTSAPQQAAQQAASRFRFIVGGARGAAECRRRLDRICVWQICGAERDGLAACQGRGHSQARWQNETPHHALHND